MKAPFKVIYSNDMTHIDTCISPYAPEPFDQTSRIGKPFSTERLRAAVDETAGIGIDAHFLQPGLGWVAWWKSEVYPFEEHVRFMKEKTGLTPDASGFARYMADGGDIVGAFVERCREKGLAPFISLRLNDSHGHEFVNTDPGEIPGWAWHVFSPVHSDRPEWRIGPDLHDWDQRVLNWAIPEVREHKFAFIREIIENYDIAGFELDFMRHCCFFREGETSIPERVEIMAGFVRSVREVLDRTARPGQHRWLCARVPAFLALHDDLGLDLSLMASAGVEMFVLSHSYFTEQAGDFARIRKAAPDAALYLEMTHCLTQEYSIAIPGFRTWVGRDASSEDREGERPPIDSKRRVYDCTIQRKTTPEEFYTTAHLAYSHGFDGVITFNFVYYREHGWGERGPSSEPPFHVFRHLGDVDWLARQPQHYFLARGWHRNKKLPLPLPVTVQAGATASFNFDLAPPQGGWKADARLRIQAPSSLEGTSWEARWNDRKLEETDDRSEPYEHPYPQLLGRAEEHRAWIIPQEALQRGINQLEVTMTDGPSEQTLWFIDIAAK